jgi:hypothetical protein
MNRLVLSIALICLTELAFSQSDYRNGYVITNANDTVFGLVDYREKANAFESCNFKVSGDQNTVNYGPGSIIGYGFKNDKFFQSREVSIRDQSSQVVFLEVIVRGLVSLYRFKDAYFVEKGTGGLSELINEKKELVVGGRRMTRNTYQYIGTINRLVFDCFKITAKVQKARLTEKSLSKLIEDYNRCKGVPGVTFKDKKPWLRAQVGATAGLNVSQLNFDDVLGYQHLAGNFDVSKSPMIGASLNIFSPRLSERFSFQGDLFYLTSNYNNYTIDRSDASPKNNYISIELEQLKIPIGIRYTFPKREFTPYLNLGVSSTIHVGSNRKWVQKVEAYGVVHTYEYEALAIKDKQFGLWGGGGVIKSINNKLNAFIELRYERTDGIAPFSVVSDGPPSKISNFQILIGIRTR